MILSHIFQQKAPTLAPPLSERSLVAHPLFLVIFQTVVTLEGGREVAASTPPFVSQDGRKGRRSSSRRPAAAPRGTFLLFLLFLCVARRTGRAAPRRRFGGVLMRRLGSRFAQMCTIVKYIFLKKKVFINDGPKCITHHLWRIQCPQCVDIVCLDSEPPSSLTSGSAKDPDCASDGERNKRRDQPIQTDGFWFTRVKQNSL